MSRSIMSFYGNRDESPVVSLEPSCFDGAAPGERLIQIDGRVSLSGLRKIGKWAISECAPTVVDGVETLILKSSKDT